MGQPKLPTSQASPEPLDEIRALSPPGPEHCLGLRRVGTYPNAKPVNYMARIDYVLLERVE